MSDWDKLTDGSWLKDGAAGFFTGGLQSIAQGMFNAREADEQRRFQREMSNTAYRRAANDLERAGLNRIIAFGSPASTPTGAKAEISKPNAVETGIAAATAKQQIAQSKAQESLLDAQKSLVSQQERSAKATADKDEVVKGFYEAIKPMADSIFKEIRDFSSGTASAIKSFEGKSVLDLLGLPDLGFGDAPEEYQGKKVSPGAGDFKPNPIQER